MTTFAYPQDPNFSHEKAMELAHLIERAYQQYDCYDNKKPWLPEATKNLVGSTAFLENVQDLDQKNFIGKVEYEILDILKFTGRGFKSPASINK